jgi:hypothetical protein
MSIEARSLSVILRVSLALFAGGAAAEPGDQPVSADWPQYRGPNRGNIAVNCPKLLDRWPTEDSMCARKPAFPVMICERNHHDRVACEDFVGFQRAGRTITGRCGLGKMKGID